jgi:hypothetical protein
MTTPRSGSLKDEEPLAMETKRGRPGRAIQTEPGRDGARSTVDEA